MSLVNLEIAQILSFDKIIFTIKLVQDNYPKHDNKPLEPKVEFHFPYPKAIP